MIYRDKWKIYLTKHAYNQSLLRGIEMDTIEATLRTGRIKEFGKNYISFINRYKRGIVICVGEKKSENIIDILTVEVKQL